MSLGENDNKQDIRKIADSQKESEKDSSQDGLEEQFEETINIKRVLSKNELTQSLQHIVSEIGKNTPKVN